MALAMWPAIGPAPARAEMVYRIATMGEPKTLDPHGVSGTWENYVVGDAFMGLLTDAADATPIPGAAESWTISDDGLTYTFKIRDHTWSDGVPVTADDFVYSFRRILDPKLAAEYASLLYPIKNAEEVNTGKITDPAAARRPGDRPQDPGDHAGGADRLLPRAADPLHRLAGAQARRSTSTAPTGSSPATSSAMAPFTIIEWTPNAQIVAVKNPKFYDAANVKLDKVIYYPDEDRNAVTKRFRAGEIDFVDDFASEQIDFLKRELPNETRIAPYLGTYYYSINVKRTAVRRSRRCGGRCRWRSIARRSPTRC